MVDIFEPNMKGTWATEIKENINQVNAPPVWNQTNGTGAKLLIIDSGVPNTHADLNPFMVQGCDGSNGVDQLGHGTHVAGIAAAVQNGQDVVGVAHGVELWSSKTGTTTPETDFVKCAVEFGRINNVDVMNMSIDIASSSALIDEIKGAYYQNDIVLVAAAGNSNGGNVQFPANMFEVIAVTAVNRFNEPASFAVVGPEIELSAPGVIILSTSLPSGSVCGESCDSDTGTCSGTSMAAPHVAGAAALLRANQPSLSNVDVRNLLNNNAQSIPGSQNEVGNGLLDVAAAIALTADIIGPSVLTSGDQGNWQADVKNGQSSYSYQWYYRETSGSPWISGSTSASFSHTFDNMTNHSQNASVKVEVTSGSEVVEPVKEILVQPDCATGGQIGC